MASHLDAAIATIAFGVAGSLACCTLFAVTLATGTPDQRAKTKHGTCLFATIAILILLKVAQYE